MTLQQIVERDAYLSSLPMGPERWKGDIELRNQKAACADYKHSSQQMSFKEWLTALMMDSRLVDVQWASDSIRASYYEGQPEVWIEYYDSGASPEEAISSDMECWD